MLNKTCVGLGIGLFSLLTVLPVGAQEVATLALRNGERPSGELVDMNASGFVLRINGQSRSFGAGDVAAVEFVVGPVSAEAQAKINAGQPFVVLRNGQLIDGRLTDVGGTRPLRLTIATSTGSRDLTSSDVAQVYVNPVAASTQAAAPPAPAPAPIPAGAITVPANVGWTDSGIAVAPGQRVQFTATGDIMISNAASSGVGGSPAATVATIKYPVAGAPVGALIGRIGNGAPFLIGANTSPILMRTLGRLMLGINDDNLPDNSGNFYVTVTRSR
jgi:hypothetical protein